MKTAFLVSFVILMLGLEAQASAPYGIKGQQQSSTLYSNVHQFPNNQVTNIGGINALVETGNNNLLVNPSFESYGAGSGWSGNFVTQNISTAKAIVGKQANELVIAAATFTFLQDSTLNATQFADGVQGLAYCRISSDIAVNVCSRNAGTTSSTNCVTTNTDSKWGLYKVPFILGATSNGISIASSGSVTGTVYVDDCFVGAVDLKQDINNVGAWTTFTPTGSWTANTTYTGKYRQVGENLEMEVLLSTSGAPTSAGLTIDLPTGFTIDTTKMVSSTAIQDLGEGVINDSGASFFKAYAIYSSTTAIAIQQSEAAVTYLRSIGVTQAVPMTWGSGDTLRIFARVPVTQFSGSSSVYTAQNNNSSDISQVIFTSQATAPENFISAMNKSIGATGSGATYTGNDYYALYEVLWTQAGLSTTAGDVYKISSSKGASALADFNANKTILIDYETNAPFIRGKAAAASLGAYQSDALQGHWHDFRYTGGASSVSWAVGSGGPRNGQTVSGSPMDGLPVRGATTDGVNGTPRTASETRPKNVSLNAYIKYRSNNVIIGTFNEVDVTPGVTKPKTCHYAFGGAGATLASPTECTTGTCIEVEDNCGTGTPPAWGGTTGFYNDLTFAAGTFANSSLIECDCVGWDTTTATVRSCETYFTTGDNTWMTTASGGYVLGGIGLSLAAGTAGDGYATVTCKGSSP